MLRESGPGFGEWMAGLVFGLAVALIFAAVADTRHCGTQTRSVACGADVFQVSGGAAFNVG